MNISLELQPCLKNKSGIGIYTYELTKRLQSYEDLQITGNLFNFLNRNDLTRDMEGLEFNKNTCSTLPYRGYCKLWNYLPIKYNHLFKQLADITHFFNFIVPPRIEGKVVNCIHDLTFLLYPETMDKKNLARITRDITYSIERADRIVTISKSTERDLIHYLKVPAEKIEIIYPGVDSERFRHVYTQEEKVRVSQKYHLPKRYVLYMGTIEPRKNIESIVEAFYLYKKELINDVQDVKLVIAGKKGWLYESLFERVKKLNLEEEVIFTDYVDEQDKPLIYQMASVFVFPSLYEGFGIPVLEAMASGTPVITSNVSSLPEVAGDAAIMVDPKDTLGIAKGMTKCMGQGDDIKEIIEKGHRQVKLFNWDESAHKLYNLYVDLLRNN